MFIAPRTLIRIATKLNVDVELDGRLFILSGTVSVPEDRGAKTLIEPQLTEVREALPDTNPNARFRYGRATKIPKDEFEALMDQYGALFQEALRDSVELSGTEEST